MRTKQEVISFLESKVGTKVVCVGNSSLDGQCVSLIKSLMEYLGVPDPYKARGHAKDCIAKYISEGLAKPGMGFISVFSNKDMGQGYGHIWCNAGEGTGTFYESNGAKPLTVTKGKTYSYDSVCNFDSYIGEDTYRGYDLNSKDSMKICVDDHIKVAEGQLVDKSQYEAIKGQFTESQKQIEELSSQLGTANSTIKALTDKVESQTTIIAEYNKEDAVQIATLKEAQTKLDKVNDDLWGLLMILAEKLKISVGSDDADTLINKIVEALEGQIQTNVSYQSQVKDLEKKLSVATTHRKPIDKISNKELLYIIISRLLKRS